MTPTVTQRSTEVVMKHFLISMSDEVTQRPEFSFSDISFSPFSIPRSQCELSSMGPRLRTLLSCSGGDQVAKDARNTFSLTQTRAAEIRLATPTHHPSRSPIRLVPGCTYSGRSPADACSAEKLWLATNFNLERSKVNKLIKSSTRCPVAGYDAFERIRPDSALNRELARMDEAKYSKRGTHPRLRSSATYLRSSGPLVQTTDISSQM